MAKRTSIAKQLGLSDDPVEPAKFSREAFKLTPVPVRGGGWSTVVADTPAASETNIGRMAGALSQVSGLLAQAKAFEDKKLEMEQRGLQIDHQTALSQLQGQAMDARIGELATKMDMSQQMTAEAVEANYWAGLSYDERERAERENADYVEVAAKQHTEAQNELLKATAQTPLAKQDPVVKSERRELYRGAAVSRDFSAHLQEALEEWAEGEGEEGVQFRPSEEDFDAFVIQFTERYKGEHNIELGSTADKAFNTATRKVFENEVHLKKAKLFAALEGEVLADDINQASDTIGNIMDAGGSLTAVNSTLLFDEALEAPWWNTLKGRNLKQKDAFFRVSVDEELAKAHYDPAALERAKLLLSLPDRDADFKYRSDAPFSESNVYEKQMSRILAAEEALEDKRIDREGKAASSISSQMRGHLALQARGQSADENVRLSLYARREAADNPSDALFRSIFPAELTAQDEALLEKLRNAPMHVRSDVAQSMADAFAQFANNQDATYEALNARLVAQNSPEYGVLHMDGGRYTGNKLVSIIRAEQIELSPEAAKGLGFTGISEKDPKPYRTGAAPDEVLHAMLPEKALREEVFGPAMDIRKRRERTAVDKYLQENDGAVPSVDQMTSDLRDIFNDIYGRQMLEDIARLAEEAKQRHVKYAEKFDQETTLGGLEALQSGARRAPAHQPMAAHSVSAEGEVTNQGALPWWEGETAFPSTLVGEEHVGNLYKRYQDAERVRIKAKKPADLESRTEEAKTFIAELAKGRDRYEGFEREARRGIIDMYKQGYGAVTASPPQTGRDNFPSLESFYPVYFKQQRAWEQKMAQGVNMEDLKGYMHTTILNGKSTGNIVLDTQENYWNTAADEMYAEQGHRPESHPSDWPHKGGWGGTPTYNIQNPNAIREQTTRQTASYLYMDNAVRTRTMSIIKPPIVNLPPNIVKRDAGGVITSVNEEAFMNATNLKPEGMRKFVEAYGFDNPKDFLIYQYNHPVARSQALTGKKLDFK